MKLVTAIVVVAPTATCCWGVLACAEGDSPHTSEAVISNEMIILMSRSCELGGLYSAFTGVEATGTEYLLYQ